MGCEPGDSVEAGVGITHSRSKLDGQVGVRRGLRVVGLCSQGEALGAEGASLSGRSPHCWDAEQGTVEARC